MEEEKHKAPRIKILNTAKVLAVVSFILVFLGVFQAQRVWAREETGDPEGRQAALLLSPRIETVLEGSTFDVSVLLDSRGTSVNAVELNLKFPPDKLAIVSPSSGKSLLSLWVAPPTYSNTKGTVSFAGIVPNGITTQSGLVSTITFQAKTTGRAIVEVLASSRVLANDGLGTDLLSEFGRGIYTIEPRPPEGVKVFSETHPFENKWYNNPSPVLTWEKVAGTADFSFELDNKPLTVPDNIPETEDAITSYEDLADGLWYFHIKARKQGVWGSVTHFVLRIDTTAPAEFTPEIEIIKGATVDKVLVSFFTTDSLSGIDHWEVGIIDRKQSPLESPVFVTAESPYQLPSKTPGDLRVIVRAHDRAGNVRDEAIDIEVPVPLVSFVKKHLAVIYGATLGLLFLLTVLHYLLRHKAIALLRRTFVLLKKEKQKQEEEEHHKKHRRGGGEISVMCVVRV